MTKLNFFDCNCSVGRVARPHLLDLSTAQDLLREMDTAGINEALVYHTVARDSFPPMGNSMLLEEIRDEKRLHPVWVVLPHHTNEMPTAKELVTEIKKNRVRAARIYPKLNRHSFSIADWSAGELFEALEEANIPLILDMETLSWEQVETILSTFKNLPLIAATCTYRNNRYIYPLLEKYSHFYIELSRFMGAGTIEDIVSRFGSGSLLFGSNMPRYTGTAAVALITYAEIDESDKRAIASGNLRKLLGPKSCGVAKSVQSTQRVTF